jgi:putative ABC transport system permease protein
VRPAPPRLAARALDRWLDPDAAEAIGGDLAEEFARRAASSSLASARRWYVRQVASTVLRRRRSIPSLDSPAPSSLLNWRTFMDRLWQDLHFAFRTIRRAPGFSAIAMLTLAVGIGAATVIGTAADRALLETVPYPTADRLVVAGSGSESGGVGNVGFETALDWRTRVPSFEGLSLIRGWQPIVVDEGGAAQLSGMRVSWNFFRLLGVRPALGRDFEEAEDNPARFRVVMLSDGLWRRRFGARADIAGSTITLNGVPYLVAGVMPATFEPVISAHFYASAELWGPLGYAAGGSSSCRSCQHLKSVALLRPGASAAAAQAELATVQTALRVEHPADYDKSTPVVRGLRDEIASPMRLPLQVLVGAVAFLLLVACANVAGLLVARATDRERELAVRSAIGADRFRLVRQLLTESLVMAALATLAGVAFARWGLQLLAAYSPVLVPRLGAASGDPRMLLVGAGVAVLALVAFGLLPAWTSARTDLQSVLREGRQSGSRRALRARELLMMAQVAIALLLVAGAGLMYRTVDRLLKTNPGFDSHGVVTAGVALVGPRWAKNEAVLAFHDDVLRRLDAVPGIERAAFAAQVPLTGNYDRRGFHVEGRVENSADAPEAEFYPVSPDYFRVMRVPLRRGRLLTDADAAGKDLAAVIGETAAARIFPGEDPIGHRVSIGDDKGPYWTIVGVTGDVRHYGLDETPNPQVYVTQQQFPNPSMLVVRSTMGFEATRAAMRREVAALAADVPVTGVATLDDSLRTSIASRRFLMALLSGFAATALLLAAVGLYGVVSQGVASRRREFGIRLALGASSRDVFALVLKRGLQLVGIGVVTGLVASAWLGRLLGSQLYETAPHDPITLAGAIAVLGIVAVAAHVVPARRAIRVDPSITLRND